MKPQPTFDAQGYPTEDTLKAIRGWPYPYDGLLEYVRSAWRDDYGRIWEAEGFLKMATGGWSGNEDIVAALRDNLLFWASRWESSHRGGLTVLRK